MKTKISETVMLTAFEVFGKYNLNPTEILVESLGGKNINNFQILAKVFPTQVLLPDGSPNPDLCVLRYIIQNRYKAIIALGHDSGAKGVKFESTSINWVKNPVYCQPHEQCKLLDQQRPAKHKRFIDLTLWKIDAIQKKMHAAGIPYEKTISSDAKSFCCNALIYRVLAYMAELEIKIPFLYLHVPSTQASIAGIKDFDPRKTIIREDQLEELIKIVLSTI